MQAARSLGAPLVLAAAEAQLGDVYAAAGDELSAGGIWATARDRVRAIDTSPARELADRLATRGEPSQAQPR